MATVTKILVLLGDNTRVVSFECRGDMKKAICETFKDVLEPNQDFFLQIKSEEWGGVFVDLTNDQEVGDKSVVKAVVKPPSKREVLLKNQNLCIQKYLYVLLYTYIFV